jgi:purine nucleosidase
MLSQCGWAPGRVPVVAGAGWSLTDGAAMGGLPDHEAFWGPGVEEPEVRAVDPAAAVALLDRSIAAGATICTIGPLTNLGLLEAARPGRLASASLVSMGGWVRPMKPGYPDWDETRDFNVQCDQRSAATAFAVAGSLTLVTIAATAQIHVRDRHLERLEESGRLGRLLARMIRAHGAQYGLAKLAERHSALPPDLHNFHHDPLAVAVAVGWDHGIAERHEVEGRRATVISDCEPLRFLDDWLAVVGDLSRSLDGGAPSA